MNQDSSLETCDGTGVMFDRIAARYDLLNRVMSFGMDRMWRQAAANELKLGQHHRVLDLATGTADLALEIASRDPSINVVGLDPSVRMLAIGRKKVVASSHAGQIELIEGDAQALPFANGVFDGVTMAFGIRNVPDRGLALREIGRVLKHDGRVCILELSEPGEGWLAIPARVYVRSVIPWIGAILSGAREYRYLQRSIAAFPKADAFAQMMTEANLTVLSVRSLGFGACHLYVATRKERNP